MPNWCQNTAHFTNSDKEQLDKLESELKKENGCEVLKHLRPYEGEWEYMWCVENWGTKWEANVYNWERMNENTITINFDTAWGPPLTLFEFLTENGWEVEAFYNEEGMCFAGIYDNGYHEEYEYSGMSADDIEEALPHELNEMYNISTYRREWEEENQDDEEITFDDDEWEKAEITPELQEHFQKGLGNLEQEMTEEEKEEALKQLKQDYENLLKDK